MKTTLTGALALLALSLPLHSTAQTPDLLKDKICLPFGSKDLTKITSDDINLSTTTTKRFKFGAADIPTGCEVGFQTTEEQASSYTDEYMESIRSISFIRCSDGFTLAGKQVHFANFDLNGCLKRPLFMQSDIKVCGKLYRAGEELPVENGKISCPKPSK